MPSTRPGITFDSEGICSACRAHEKKATVDWEQRYKELETLCDKYRGMNGDGYDCMIAVSGGKVAWGYSGTMKYNGGTYNVVNGTVKF